MTCLNLFHNNLLRLMYIRKRANKEVWDFQHTHYTLSVAIELVHLFSYPAPCGKRPAELMQTARRYKQVYRFRRVAKNVLLYSLY